MLPKSREGEKKHRKHKRELEITMAVDAIEDLQGLDDKQVNENKISILEFGCGDGFQIPYLDKMGSVIASDVTRGDTTSLHGVEFVECSITDTPFDDRSFDVIYSNHVVEHIENIDKAFDELLRIGKNNCIYAFSVPTNTWLLLSLPAQYLSKLKSFIKIVQSKLFIRNKSDELSQAFEQGSIKGEKEMQPENLAALLMPSGHGVTVNYAECYNGFKVKSWYKLFSNNGFSILETKPLLLYGPSEWPVIPIMKCKFGLSSSVLFLMSKKSPLYK